MNSTTVTPAPQSKPDHERTGLAEAGIDRAEDGDPAIILATARENIRLLNEFQDEEHATLSRLQIGIEAISRFFGSSSYFLFVVAFIAVWMTVNAWGSHAGWKHVDEPPFFVLQGLVSANALLLTVAVLIRQNRMAKQAARRAHLDLHINLLTEQKVSKVLELLGGVAETVGHATESPESVDELTTAADPKAILAAIKESEDGPGHADSHRERR